jgi:peptide/nickel transport system permease protein
VAPGDRLRGPGAGAGQWLRHAILPGFALSLLVTGMVARQLRTSVVAALQENYAVGARVRGLSRRRVLLVHVLRNAAAPTVAAIGLEVPQLLGGAVITETVFALPGLGQYALEGAQNHDVPVIQGVLVVMVVLVLISNLGVDLLLGWMRPGTRRSR